jgi:hypothetical protein
VAAHLIRKDRDLADQLVRQYFCSSYLLTSVKIISFK